MMTGREADTLAACLTIAQGALREHNPTPRRHRGVIAVKPGCCRAATFAAAIMAAMMAALPSASAATVSAPGPYAPCFTNRFNADSAQITIAPDTNGCIFYAGESVRITSSAPIEVYRLAYDGKTSPITNHLSPIILSNLTIGHYFIQSGSDRNEFVVLPSNYGTLTRIGHGDYYAVQGVPEIDVHQKRAKLNWVRAALNWGTIQITNGAAFDWRAAYNGSPDETNLTHWAGREKIIFLPNPANWAAKLSFSAWLTAYSNFLHAAYLRYSNIVAAVQPLNEPNQDSSINAVFTNGDYGSFQASTYRMAATAWPSTSIIGPSEDTPWDGGRVARFAATGGNVYLAALDMHDYWNKHPSDGGAPDDPTNGIPSRITANLTTLGKTSLFVTELGLPGGSALGYPASPDSHNAEHSQPHFGWTRGLARAIKTAILYAQTNSVLLVFNFMDGANIEIAGFDRGGNSGGIKPKTAAFLMANHWLSGRGAGVRPAIFLTNWTSGALHFSKFIFAGSTNTFLWSAEGSQTSTNLGAPFISDIWSNAVTGPITEEPVIAWSWP